MKVAYDYPYRLKLDHADRAEVRLARAGRTIVFDPVEIHDGDIVVLTSPSPDRIRATAEAVKLTGSLPVTFVGLVMPMPTSIRGRTTVVSAAVLSPATGSVKLGPRFGSLPRRLPDSRVACFAGSGVRDAPDVSVALVLSGTSP